MNNFLFQLSDLLKTYYAVAICTIVETNGSTPMKNGAKIIVCPDRKILGTIGGGALEKCVVENAITCLNNNESKLFVHHLTKDHQMCCGGTVKVFIDIIKRPSNLFIFGAGHVGSALARIASFQQDLEIFLIDDRPFYVHQIQTDIHYKSRINGVLASPVEWIQHFDEQMCFNSFCVIVTYNHQLDREILLNALSKNFKYVGMIGSQRKVLVTKKFLLQKNIPEDVINTIDMPIGMNIHAYYPEEIAVSILAKIISVKNQQIHEHNNISDSGYSEHYIKGKEDINVIENMNVCLKNL